MSAFIVSRAHIAYLVQAALRVGELHHSLSWCFSGDGVSTSSTLRAGDYEEAARVGQFLWDENIRSVQARYRGDTRETLPGPVGETFRYEKHPLLSPPEPLDPVQVLKACECYEYQSCEHDGWQASEAHAFIQALKAAAIHALPGWDAAQWEITADRPRRIGTGQRKPCGRERGPGSGSEGLGNAGGRSPRSKRRPLP